MEPHRHIPQQLPPDDLLIAYSYPRDERNAPADRSLPEMSVNRSINSEGREHKVTLSTLASARSITVGLDHTFLCDCHDLTHYPLAYRLHLYLGASQEVPFEVKRERMAKWQEAISIFDALMTEESHLPVSDLRRCLPEIRLPRGEVAVISTAHRGLRELFLRLGGIEHPKPPHELIIRWDRLKAAAQSGEFLECWLAQRKDAGLL